MLPSGIYVDLIGKPWLAHARGPDAFDCVGLLLEMQRRLGRVVGDFPSAEGSFDLTRGCGEWERVYSMEPGDALLYRSVSPRWHVAVFIGSNRFIHAKQFVGVAVERLDSMLWRRRLQGIYRWRVPELDQSESSR